MPTITGAIIQADGFVATAATGVQVAFGGTTVNDVALRKYATGEMILVKGDNSAMAALRLAGIFAGGLIDASDAAAGQIKFPATQNASANVNTLDDYEEGIWTPSLGGTTTYTVQAGRYTKVGRLVIVTFSLSINVIGTGSTTIISGLPFSVTGDGVLGCVGWFNTLASSVVWLGLQGNPGGSTITVYSLTAAGASAAANAVFGNSAKMDGTVAYFTS